MQRASRKLKLPRGEGTTDVKYMDKGKTKNVRPQETQLKYENKDGYHWCYYRVERMERKLC